MLILLAEARLAVARPINKTTTTTTPHPKSAFGDHIVTLRAKLNFIGLP